MKILLLRTRIGKHGHEPRPGLGLSEGEGQEFNDIFELLRNGLDLRYFYIRILVVCEFLDRM